jgi:hypothetical protein
MLQKVCVLSLFLAVSAISAGAQDCKLKFSVAYTDGKTVQVGLTPEQKKMWDHDAAKKFKSLCLDDKAPDFLVLWNQGLNGAELAQVGVDRANVILSTGQTATTTTAQASVTSAYHYVRPSSQVRGKALYTILDASKKPYEVIHQGEGYQDVPRDVKTGVDRSVNASDVASTVPDPAAALENALKWLKKVKKI